MKKNNIKKIIIIIISILFIVLMIYIIKSNITSNKTEIIDGKYTKEDVQIINNNVNEYLSDKIVPRGLSRLYGAYKGKNEMSDLYRQLYLFVNYLPKIANNIRNLEEDKLEKYYSDNSKELFANVGIDSLEKFLPLAKYIKDTNYNGELFDYCQIKDTQFETDNEYFTFNLYFYFKSFEKEIVLKVHFANIQNKNPMVYYTIIEDNK